MRYRMKRVLVRVRRWTYTGLKLLVLFVGLLYLATRVGPGYRALAGIGLSQANRALAGTITVGSVESRGILGGAFLSDVRFEDPMGRPFVTADSVRARYSLFPLLRGELLFNAAEVWGARVVVEKLPEYEGFNYEYAVWGAPRSQRPSDGEDDGEGFLRWLRIFQAQIHDAEVVIRLPGDDRTEPPAVGNLRTLESGERVVEMTFTNVTGSLPQAVVRAPGQEGEEFRIASLTLDTDMLSEPIGIRDLRGTIRREGQEARFVAPRIWLVSSEASGEGLIDWSLRETLQAELDLSVEVVTGSDLQWLPFPVPDGSAAGGFSLARGPASMSMGFQNFEARLATGGEVRGDLRLTTGDELYLDGVDMVLSGFGTRELDTWIPDSPLPEARMDGPVRFSGSLNALQVDGRLRVSDPLGELSGFEGEARGVVHVPAPFGITGMSVVTRAFDFGWLGRWDERIPFTGLGSVDLDLSGQAGQGFQGSGALVYGFGEEEPSSLSFQATVEGSGPEAGITGAISLSPLSLDVVAAEFANAATLSGGLAGELTLGGTLGALQVGGPLQAPGGTVRVTATTNLLDPAAGYDLSVASQGFRLGSVVSGLPEDATLAGRAEYEGLGLTPADMTGSGSIEVADAVVGSLRVDSARAVVSLADGLLRADTLEAETSALNLRGSGELGITRESGVGRIELRVNTPSLEGLRPYLRDGDVVARDTLNDISRQALTMAGVNPDTLPLLEDVITEGTLDGTVVLTGALNDFAADVDLTFANARYGKNTVAGAHAEGRLEGLPSLEGRWQGLIEMDSAVITRQRFSSGRGQFDFQFPRGSGEIRLARSETEDYLARGTLELAGDSARLFLDQLTLRFEEDQWNLGGPTSFLLAHDSLDVRDLSLLRQGQGGMRLRADGVLTRSGPADFTLSTQRLDVARLVRLLQVDVDAEGLVDVEADVSGTGSSPVVEASLGGVGLRFGSLEFDTLFTAVSAADQRLRANVTGWYRGERAVVASVDLGVDLRADAPEGRFLDEDLDIRVALQEFPAEGVMGFLETVEDVEGTVGGTITFQGRPSDLQPGGQIALSGGSARFPALNVRHTDVEAVIELNADRSADVEGHLYSGTGRADVSGTLTLDPLRDPAFDLNIQAADLVAVQRRDLTGTLSGTAHLGGNFTSPVVTGQIQVDRGELRLEEFVRSASVVDLTSPDVVDLIDDQSILTLDGVLLESRNPFMNNLRLDVDLSVRGDTWIRSRELDVEMSGDMGMVWDRAERSLVLVGELNAVRGAYNAFNRRLEVESGTVGFPGTAEINPTLNIQARTLIRTNRGEPLNIQANLEGTLLEPRVFLSSDFQPPIAESDLVSYLLFGQPSSGLLESQSGVAGAGVALALGSVTAALGSQISQGVPFLDYLSVTARPPEGGAAAASASSNQFLAASVEGGMYLRRDVFLGFRLPNVNNPSANNRPDLWLEITAWNAATLEVFFEDRFSRDRVTGLGQLSFTTPKVWGGLLYKEWGY
jgi:hypothetical protein